MFGISRWSLHALKLPDSISTFARKFLQSPRKPRYGEAMNRYPRIPMSEQAKQALADFGAVIVEIAPPHYEHSDSFERNMRMACCEAAEFS